MDILRTNYSTLSPYAQQDAPSAPEYPYTEILAAYRGAIEAGVDEVQEDAQTSATHLETNHTFHHNQAFQKILKHFFGDYFTVDADEELASDMADRWAAFSRTGNPNYDGSPEEWLPWWNHPNASMAFSEDSDDLFLADYDELWGDFDQRHFSSGDEGVFYSDDEFGEFDESERIVQKRSLQREQYYRRKALRALVLEVAEEDVFRTELRRSRSDSLNSGDRIGGLLSRYYGPQRRKAVKDTHQGPKYDPEQVLRMAQEMGIMGEGLLGNGNQRSEFLPEFLDLSWPPEERLIERDCTCDMWDRIRYRY